MRIITNANSSQISSCCDTRLSPGYKTAIYNGLVCCSFFTGIILTGIGNTLDKGNFTSQKDAQVKSFSGVGIGLMISGEMLILISIAYLFHKCVAPYCYNSNRHDQIQEI